MFSKNPLFEDNIKAKRLPRRPKTPPRRPKKPPRRPKTPPRCLQDAPRRPLDAPRRLQDAPRRPQDGPRRLQEAPRGPQDAPRPLRGSILERFGGSKMLPKWLPKRSPNTVGNETPKSLILHNPPWFLVVFSFQLGSKNGPKWKENGFQNGSDNVFGKGSQKMTPKTAPGRPKTVPGRPQDARGRPREAPGRA